MHWLESSFSPGCFKSHGRKTTARKDWRVALTKEAPCISEEPSAVFPCPNGGCTKVFQYHSSLEKHLSLEKCTQSFERQTLLDHAKLGYKSRLEEGIGYTVSVTSVSSAVRKEVPPSGLQVEKGWALKCIKKPFCFNEKQKAYLDAKFSIGQASGKKIKRGFSFKRYEARLGKRRHPPFQSVRVPNPTTVHILFLKFRF